jgi:hypothetical protein
LAPVAVSISSGAPSIFATPQPISFLSGTTSQVVTLTPQSPGLVTLTIQTPTGFSTPSTGTTATLQVR